MTYASKNNFIFHFVCPLCHILLKYFIPPIKFYSAIREDLRCRLISIYVLVEFHDIPHKLELQYLKIFTLSIYAILLVCLLVG